MVSVSAMVAPNPHYHVPSETAPVGPGSIS
jgi:hypothetical protein